MGMNKLPRDRRIQIISLLAEGMSLRAIARTTGVSINTVTKLLVDAGRACSDYQDRTFRNLTCKRVQVDEVWSFVYARTKNIEGAKAAPDQPGDIWTWTAIDADTKLIPSWYVGRRDAEAANIFISDLAARLTNRVQLTSDGHGPYLKAVEDAFGTAVDHAMLVKVHGEPQGAVGRYSPGECVGAEKRRVEGRPDPAPISTSFVERSNLTLRMNSHRFTRLTNAFSKKAENHAYAVGLHLMVYNYVSIQNTLKCSPAIAAGITSKLWEIADVVTMIEEWEKSQASESN
jgi:IS1 family transposase